MRSYGMISRTLGVALILTALALMTLAVSASSREVTIYRTWQTATGVVDEITTSQIDQNKYGSVRLKLHFLDGAKERAVWADQSFAFASRGERFARSYEKGTRHTVWLDPNDPTRGEVEIGWNLEAMLVPLFLLAGAVATFLGGRYFWRLR